MSVLLVDAKGTLHIMGRFWGQAGQFHRTWFALLFVIVNKTITVPIDRLRAGMNCSQPIMSEDGVLLIGGGTHITEALLCTIRESSIHSISIDVRDLPTLQPEKRSLKKLRSEQSGIDITVSAAPLKSFLIDRFNEDLSEERAALLHQKLEEANHCFDVVDRRIKLGLFHSANEFLDLSENYARTMIDDHDHTVGMLNSTMLPEITCQRSIRMGVLGMSVAIEMGFSGPQTLEVGLTGMLHDIGLSKMSLSLDAANNPIDPRQDWEYQKHPLVSAQCVEQLDIPESVSLAIQQVHEQLDGSGYPRGLKGLRIHPYARVLNVVDAFLQLTTGTDDRPGIIPHDAMGYLLHKASKGVFDAQVVKAFLQSESLFPLGSFVELSNGELSSVIRRPKSGYAAPVLRDSQGTRVDLSETNLRIVRPIGTPGTKQTRMTSEMMDSLTWNPGSGFAYA
ncbi:hypothetical protein Pla22_47140 [Rubripirellula amarantea]|uniref:HD-GYP domain-containing protein n=1 Tax=Rubripirellula amarantea TaxID=2527999 RepID=A0A5C5WG53_9BACT|nr:HD domain-containing phosphohydrolase [Rubripirellula amarantea]TWT49517.1 hypothetical protein Pla22_47140 [Rubripirellula amarantea]